MDEARYRSPINVSLFENSRGLSYPHDHEVFVAVHESFAKIVPISIAKSSCTCVCLFPDGKRLVAIRKGFDRGQARSCASRSRCCTATSIVYLLYTCVFTEFN